MADVTCLKDGRFAVTNAPHLPQVEFKNGDVLRGIQTNFAERLIELGFAEKFDGDPVDEDDEEEKGNGDNGRKIPPNPMLRS